MAGLLLTVGIGALTGAAFGTGSHAADALKASRERQKARERQEAYARQQQENAAEEATARERAAREARAARDAARERAAKEARERRNARDRERRRLRRLEATTRTAIEKFVASNPDVAVLDAPKPLARAKSPVPSVRGSFVAQPTTRELLKRMGLEGLREMTFAGVWLLIHKRPNPHPERAHMGIALAASDREAFDQLLALAGVDRKQAKAEGLTYREVQGPVPLTKRLHALGYGEFDADTGELLLPFSMVLMRHLFEP